MSLSLGDSIYRNMNVERHILACSVTMKAISKTGSLGSCFVSVDIGSSERLAMQNLQISKTAGTRIIPKWLLSTQQFRQKRYTSSGWSPAVQMLYWLLPSPAKAKNQQASNKGGWILWSCRGKLRETRSTSAAPPAAASKSTFSRQHRLKDLRIFQLDDIHLIEIKF
jgi:hypothetical protein